MLPTANLSTSWLRSGDVVFHVERGPGECTRKWVRRFARLPVPTGKSNNQALYSNKYPSIVYHDKERGSLGREYTVSHQMNWSSAIHHIFTEEGYGPAWILERLRNITSNQMESKYGEEREYDFATKKLAEGMSRNCPLSLKVIHRVMREGGRGGRGGNLEGLMKRERKVQTNMEKGVEFRRWVDRRMGDYTEKGEEGGGGRY